jgi:Flp pilus assembly protein TadD
MAKRAKKKSRARAGPDPVASPMASIALRDAPAAPAPPVRRVSLRRETNPSFGDMKLILRATLILLAGFWIYWPAMNGGWLWDDRDLIADNPLIHDPNGLWKIWFEPGSLFDYLPLKVSVEWIEWRLWGEDTFGYHAVSLGLHLLSAFLLWRLFFKFGLRYAWLGGLIFTVHPIMVESVAWIAELKNTLSLPLFLLAMNAWIDFDARRKGRDYCLALGLFLLALLAKPTMVMFPLVILLYAWWKRGRVSGQDLRASAAFFGVSFGIGMATLWFLQRTVGEQDVVLGGALSRLACAGLSIAFYFSKSVLPVNLMAIYPRWIVDPPSPEQFLPWPVIGAVLCFLWTKRNGWGRHALLGVGFFLLNLVPFLGLNAGSYMKHTWVMDHILYIPIIGLIGLALAAAEQVREQLNVSLRWAGAAIIGVALILSAWASHGYARLYVNLTALWAHNVLRNPGAALPHNDLGFALVQEGRITEAIDQMMLATQLDPDFRDAHYNLGLLLMQTGRFPEALTQFQAVTRLGADLPRAHYSMAYALEKMGRTSRAIEEYERTLALDPAYADASNNLAVVLAGQNRLAEAAQILQDALQIDPDNAQLRDNLARVIKLENAPAPAKKK